MKFMFGFGIGACSILLMVAITGGRSRWVYQDEAVKAGKAEYYLDENNQRQWRWK